MLQRVKHPRLPHIHAPGLVQHVVFCTLGAFTALTAGDEDQYDIADRALDDSLTGRVLVGEAADLVVEVLLFGEPDQYRLSAWCVMPNHVHVLVTPNRDASLRDIVQRWKSISARRLNKRMKRDGAFWQANYFDRYMRDEAQVARTVEYIENNPVSAGLAVSPWEWRWSSAFVE